MLTSGGGGLFFTRLRKKSSLNASCSVSCSVSQDSPKQPTVFPSLDALSGGLSPDLATYFMVKPPFARHFFVWSICSSTSVSVSPPLRTSSTYLDLVNTEWAAGYSSWKWSARYSRATPAWLPVEETPYHARLMTQIDGATFLSRLSWKRNREYGRADWFR